MSEAGDLVTVRDLFRYRAFAVLFPAGIVSVMGSQLARLALSVLVFDRTDSTVAAALTYAATFLPAVLGGFVLGGLGDRYPRRSVMVSADLARAGLFLAMAAPGMPTAAIVALLAVAVFLDPAFSSAEISWLAEALPAEQFRASSGWRATADQTAQVIGFGAGGVIVALVSPRGALVIDAITFVVSALLVLGLLGAPRGRHHRGRGTGGVAGLSAVAGGMRVDSTVDAAPSTSPIGSLGGPTEAPAFLGLWRDHRTRMHMVFTVLVGLYVLPEALAVSFGHGLGASTTQTGILLAMIPLGSALGSAVIVRVRPALRRTLTGVLAISGGIPLIVSATQSNWAVCSLCWFVAGLLTAYQVEVTSALVAAIPPAVRAKVLGVASAWLLGSQGVAFALGGGLAGLLGPAGAIAAAAAAGCVVAALLVPGWLRREPPAAVA